MSRDIGRQMRNEAVRTQAAPASTKDVEEVMEADIMFGSRIEWV